jgi:signal transduction histidine kinase
MAINGRALRAKQRRSPHHLRVDQSDFEQLLLKISNDFVRAVSPDIEALIRKCLARLGRYVGLSGLGLYQWIPDTATLAATHKWRRRGAAQPQLTDACLTSIARRAKSGRICMLKEGRQTRVVRRTSAHANSVGVAIPLAVSGTPTALLVAVNETGRLRPWPRQMITRLQIIGEVFTHALERKREWDESQRLLNQSAHAARIAMLGELTSSLADEFRRPLESALKEASAIKRQLSNHQPELTEAASGLDNIIESGNRLAQATRLVRTLARKYTSDRSPTDPVDAIEAAVRVLSADAAFRGITLATDFQPALPAILVHKVEFQQVIMDLVVNAFEIIGETTPDVRSVVIEAFIRGGRELVISVVAKNVLPLFSNRLHVYGATPGLFISALIAEVHRGALRVKSADPADVVFEFSIPFKQD